MFKQIIFFIKFEINDFYDEQIIYTKFYRKIEYKKRSSKIFVTQNFINSFIHLTLELDRN